MLSVTDRNPGARGDHSDIETVWTNSEGYSGLDSSIGPEPQVCYSGVWNIRALNIRLFRPSTHSAGNGRLSEVNGRAKLDLLLVALRLSAPPNEQSANCSER